MDLEQTAGKGSKSTGQRGNQRRAPAQGRKAKEQPEEQAIGEELRGKEDPGSVCITRESDQEGEGEERAKKRQEEEKEEKERVLAQFTSLSAGIEAIMHQGAFDWDKSLAKLRERLLQGSVRPLRKEMVRLTGDRAQTWLDAFQLVLDRDPFDRQGGRAQYLKALLLLSKESQLAPQDLQFSDERLTMNGMAVAAGSYGDVYRSSVAGRTVAVKVLKAYQSTDFSKLSKTVRKEAIIWSHLFHTNVVPSYGVYTLPSEVPRLALVSPWMENGNVTRYLQTHRSVNRLLLISDIAAGMAYLHDQNIIHGDLKGVNILVSSEERACLADFGLSTLSVELTGWTSVQATSPDSSGTLRWQAPELMRPPVDETPLKLSATSDIYSFACVCYEIMTGMIPFHEITVDYWVITTVTEGERPPRPSTQDAAFHEFGLSDSIWDFIQSCWNQDPLLRPTALEVSQNPLLTSLLDPRPAQQWGDASAAEFRLAIRRSREV